MTVTLTDAPAHQTMPSELIATKAERLHLADAVTKQGDTFTVKGDHDTYQVSILGGPDCTCPAGINHHACSHVEAVWLDIRYGALRRAMARGQERTRNYDLNHQTD